MTDSQRQYQESASDGKLGDLLTYLTLELGRSGNQSFCSVNNGFLVNAKMLVPTSTNRLEAKSENRCLHFGTDEMIAMVEWLGREVAQTYTEEKYQGVRLLVGDISAPRGGCLIGRYGRRGHASHTSGQDADIGFLTANTGQASPTQFHRRFDAKANWWLIQKIFENPYGCIKVIFLDRKLIRSLEKVARKDPAWKSFHRFIRHMPNHRNHMHVRIGNGPGTPGCGPGARPELETEDEFDEFEAVEASIMDELKARQSSSVQK